MLPAISTRSCRPGTTGAFLRCGAANYHLPGLCEANSAGQQKGKDCNKGFHGLVVQGVYINDVFLWVSICKFSGTYLKKSP
jgi:hypothetical protein